MRFIGLLHKSPIEQWQLRYDFLGWSLLAHNDAEFAQFISEKAAMHVVKMIKRATEICAIDNGLRNIDVAYDVALDEQYFLSIERQDNKNI